MLQPTAAVPSKTSQALDILALFYKQRFYQAQTHEIRRTHIFYDTTPNYLLSDSGP